MAWKNTLQRGSVRYIVFKENKRWYAVGLEFNIVEAGDDPREVLLSLFEAIQGYVNSARKIKPRPHILNQVSDSEYEGLGRTLHSERKSSRDISSVYTFGQRALAAA